MEREQFTFYASFAKAARKIKKPAERCAYYDALIDYALSGTEPDESKLPEIACLAMELVMPALTSSRRKAESGRKGGSKPEANDKQTGSKPEAKPKQTESKAEANASKQQANPSKPEAERDGDNIYINNNYIYKHEEDKQVDNTLSSPISPPVGSPSLPPTSPSAADFFSGDLLAAVQDWLAYKAEKRQNYKPTGLRSLFYQLRKAADKHGEAAVEDVIRNSIASNYMGITLDRLNSPAYKPPTGNRVVASNSNSSDPVTYDELNRIRNKLGMKTLAPPEDHTSADLDKLQAIIDQI